MLVLFLFCNVVTRGQEDNYFVNFLTSKILEEEDTTDSIYLSLFWIVSLGAHMKTPESGS